MPRLIALPSLLIALAGCAKTTDVYEVTVSLESNTCGTNALPLPDGLSYRTQFKADPPRASWKVLPKGSPISGTFDEDDGAFRFSIAQTINLDGMDAGIGQLLCTVVRTETMTGTLRLEDEADAGDAGRTEDDYPLRGDHAISFVADSNGRCRGSSGPLGPFDRLPCEAKYTIVGEKKADR